MKNQVWKIIFLFTLTIFVLLSALMIACVYTLLSQPPSAGTSIIGGAALPTYQFLLSQFMRRNPIPYIWFVTLVAAVISLIGWRTAKK